MLLELLSSDTVTNSLPVCFGSTVIDSLTAVPYSDATCMPSKQRARPGHVKRLINAFIVLSQIKRRKTVQFTPYVTNADISK